MPWSTVRRACSSSATSPGVTGVLAGSLSALSLGELFGQLTSGLRTGRLAVLAQGVRRTVAFRDGQVVFASSTARPERLGHALVRQKLVSPAVLEAALKEVRPGVRVGQVLVKQGTVGATQAVLGHGHPGPRHRPRALRAEWRARSCSSKAVPPEDSVKLPERTRDLVLQGLKRGEELLRLRMAGPETLHLVAGVTPPQAADAALVEKVTAGPLGEALVAFDGSEHGFLRWVADRMADGVLSRSVVKPPAAAPRAEPVSLNQPESAEERFAAFVREVCEELKRAGESLAILRGYLAEPQEGQEEAFAGVKLSDEGRLDVARVMADVKSADPALARAMALEALDAFAAYALFSAKDSLPADKGAELDARFRALHAEDGG